MLSTVIYKIHDIIKPNRIVQIVLKNYEIQINITISSY